MPLRSNNSLHKECWDRLSVLRAGPCDQGGTAVQTVSGQGVVGSPTGFFTVLSRIPRSAPIVWEAFRMENIQGTAREGPEVRMEITEDITVLLADDHTLIREALATLVNAQPGMRVVGEAGDGKEALEKIAALRPSIVVMDISMPVLSGFAATTRITQDFPGTRVVVLSMHEDSSYVRNLIGAGAAGYIVKHSAAKDLIRAIRVVAGGGIFVDPLLADKVGKGVLGQVLLRGDIQGFELSEREEMVLRLIAQGYSNKEIAAQLSLSVKTVETYKARSAEKLRLDSRVDIVRYARDRGWLEDL